MYVAIVVWAILLISIIVILCKYNDILLAIAIIKTACVAIKDMPLMFVVPIVITVVVAIWWIWWLFSIAYLYSVGDISKSPNGPYAAVEHNTFTKRSLWYYIFGGLWNNAFISGVN